MKPGSGSSGSLFIQLSRNTRRSTRDRPGAAVTRTLMKTTALNREQPTWRGPPQTVVVPCVAASSIDSSAGTTGADALSVVVRSFTSSGVEGTQGSSTDGASV